jgi:hypothetical protein
VKPALVQVGKLSNLIASRSDDIGELLDAASRSPSSSPTAATTSSR